MPFHTPFIRTTRAVITTILMGVTLASLASCGGSEGSNGSAGAGGSIGPRGESANAEADRALQAKIEQHWLHTDDGWISQFTEQLPLNPPRRVYFQYRSLNYAFDVKTLTESDRLNRITWMGWTDFHVTPMRTWHEIGDGDLPKGWSNWRDVGPSYRVTVYQRDGQWHVQDENLMGMFEGVKPTSIPEG